MSFGWIDAKQFSFNSLLLMDRWLIRKIADNRNAEFQRNFAVALAGNPAVYWYVINKCPERQDYFRNLLETTHVSNNVADLRESEVFVLDALDWAIVYVYPALTEELHYVKEWDKDRLLSLTDFRSKTVLDIGSGTGRLAFAATTQAKYVYACEPVDRMRDFIREKKERLTVGNLFVVDGTVEMLPFPDESFDIVMSGHVIGDDYDREYQEMERVTRVGGCIIDCPGEDDGKRAGGMRKGLSPEWSGSASITLIMSLRWEETCTATGR